jgi:hypothetical protein
MRTVVDVFNQKYLDVTIAGWILLVLAFLLFVGLGVGLLVVLLSKKKGSASNDEEAPAENGESEAKEKSANNEDDE